MSDDLVKRLRDAAKSGYDIYGLHCDIELEAADRIEKDAQHIDEMYALVAAMNADHTASKTRIEKLEAALRTIYDCCDETGNCSVVRRIARKALEGKDD